MRACINSLLNDTKIPELRKAYNIIISQINDDILECLNMFYAETSNVQ